MSNTANRVDDSDEKSAGAIRRPSLIVIAVLFALQFVDGVDQVALAIVAPFMRAELGLGFEALGAAFTAGFIGTALGAIVFGTLGDRIDRKTVLCGAAFGFAAGSLATIWVHSGVQLFVVRLLTGLALGGLFPVVSAFALENAPKSKRATATTFVAVATTLGAASCGPLVAVLVPAFGWRSIFLFGSIAPALLALLAIFLIPNSTPLQKSAQSKARQFNPWQSVAALFLPPNRRLTLLLWIGYLCASIPMFFTLSWLPSLAHKATIAPATASITPSVFTLAGVLVALVIARAIDKSGLKVLVWTTGLGAIAIIILGQSFGDGRTLLVACGLAGAFLVSSTNLIGPAAAMLYDNSLRARGVGWAIAMMRLGGALAPALAGFLIARDISTSALFVIFALFSMIATCALYQLRNASLAH